MEIPVSNLLEPPPFRLLRKIDNVFVEGFMQRLKEDPAGPGVPPLAVLCKDVAKIELFQQRR